jgi:hypothetical protein
MHKKIWSVLTSMLASLMLATIACNGGQPSKQSPTTDAKAIQPTAIPTRAVASPNDTAGLDGDWQGKTSTDTDFSMRVKDNQITYFNFGFKIQVGSCSGTGGFGDIVNAPIIDNKFTVEWSDAAGEKVTINGTFTPDGKVSGTVDYFAKTDVCGDVSSQLKWTALNASAIAAGTVVAPAPDQPSGQADFDGSWDGANSEGNQVSFKVENNQVTYFMVNYSVNSKGCSLGGAVGDSLKNVTITDKSFSANYTDKDGRLFTFAGKFASNTEAAGTIHVKGTPDGFCGVFETEMTWTAKNSTAPSVTNSVPTVAFVNTPKVSTAIDSVAVVKGYFDALNAGNIDSAFSFLDDSLIFTIGSSANGIGKDELKTYLNTSGKGVTYTPSNFKAVGESIVNFSVQASDGTTYATSRALLSDGKIAILTLK